MNTEQTTIDEFINPKIEYRYNKTPINEPMNDHYLYCFNTGIINTLYIGVSHTLKKRLYDHTQPHGWLHDGYPNLKVLFTLGPMTQDNAYILEGEYIRSARRQGIYITNKTHYLNTIDRALVYTDRA